MRFLMQKSVDDVIQGALMHAYDPAKAHEYYMRTRKLKGRKKGAKVIPLPRKNAPKKGPGDVPPALQEQVDQLKSRLGELQARLREILSNKSGSASKSSSGSEKKTAAEKAEDARESKKYRDKHKTEIEQKRKRSASKSGGGSRSSGSSLSSMSETQVREAIARTRSNLQAAVAKARAASRGTA
jgi:hypothetical protein